VVQRLVATALTIGVFWVLTLSVSPQLHEWIHPDADHEDHECAVTLFTGGGCLPVSNPPPVIEAPSYTLLFSAPAEPAEMLVPIFAGQQIAERGPPLIGNHRDRS
jgi:hypothetical protein